MEPEFPDYTHFNKLCPYYLQSFTKFNWTCSLLYSMNGQNSKHKRAKIHQKYTNWNFLAFCTSTHLCLYYLKKKVLKSSVERILRSCADKNTGLMGWRTVKNPPPSPQLVTWCKINTPWSYNTRNHYVLLKLQYCWYIDFLWIFLEQINFLNVSTYLLGSVSRKTQ